MFTNIDLYILAFSAVTVLVTIWMGFRSAKKSKTASDFFVAGRSVGVGMNASAISGEYLSAASFMGIAGMVMSSGYDALWYPVCYACGYLFLLLFIAGPLRRFGAYTIPDFAEGRFDSPVFRKIAVVFVLFIGFFYTMPQMKGAGTTLAYIFPGLPYWAGVVLVGAVITLNVALGGMKGITLVQAFQYWAKMFAISVPIFVLMAVYGHYGKQVGMNGPSHNIVELLDANETLRNQIRPLNHAYYAPTVSGMARKVRDAILFAGRTTSPTQNWRTMVSPTTTNVIVAMVAAPLQIYADASGRSVLWQTNLNDLPRFGLDVTHSASTTDQEFAALIRKQLETNGVTFFDGPNQTVIALKSDDAKLLMAAGIGGGNPRSSLPAKAPADATWLNPFGPLTTKAAKNAAAAIGKKAAEKAVSGQVGKWVSETNSPSPTHALTHSLIPLRSGLSPDQRMTVNLDSLSVAQALGIYAELTGRQLLPNTRPLAERADDLLGHRLSRLKVITRPPAPDHGVREHGDGAFTASEVKEMVERDLLKRGWSLRPIGKTGFEAVASSTAVAKSGQKGAAEQSEARDRGAGHSGTQSLTPRRDAEYSGTQSLAPRSGAEHSGTQSLAPGSGAERSGTLLEAPSSSPEHSTSQLEAPRSEVGSIYTPLANGGSVAEASERLSRRPNGQFDVAGRLHTGSDNAYVEAKPVLLAQGPLSGGPNSNYTNQSPAATPATPDPKAGIAAAAEKAWLAKHEKPLALLYTYSLIIAIVCGTAGLPHILVRFYTNPDGTAAKKTTMWVMILIGVFYVFPPVFGVIGRNLLPDLYNGIGAKGTDKIVLELPRILNAKYPPLGSILSGITCAGAFAAFMSTFSGLLVSMTGALAHDVYGRILRPKATAEQRMRMFKIGAVIIGAVAILLGMQVEQLQINFMVGQAFAIAAASYFPLLFMAVWWRKLTMKGAATGMLTGGTLALAGISLTSFSDLKWVNLADFWAGHPLLRILCEQPAIWAVPLAIGLMIVVSKLTAKTIPADSRMKMLVLHAPEQLGLKQEYIQEHQPH